MDYVSVCFLVFFKMIRYTVCLTSLWFLVNTLFISVQTRVMALGRNTMFLFLFKQLEQLCNRMLGHLLKKKRLKTQSIFNVKCADFFLEEETEGLKGSRKFKKFTALKRLENTCVQR